VPRLLWSWGERAGWPGDPRSGGVARQHTSCMGARIATHPFCSAERPAYGGPLKQTVDALPANNAPAPAEHGRSGRTARRAAERRSNRQHPKVHPVAVVGPAEHGRSGRMARRAAERRSNPHRPGILCFGRYKHFAKNSYTKNTVRLGGFGAAGRNDPVRSAGLPPPHHSAGRPPISHNEKDRKAIRIRPRYARVGREQERADSG